MTDLADVSLLRLAPRRLAGPWTFLRETLAEERERWILWLPVWFAAGIGAYFSLAAEPALWMGIAAAASLCLALALAAWLHSALAMLLLAPLAAAFCGFAAAEWRTAGMDSPLLRRATPAIELHGRVLSVELTKTGQRILLDRVRIAGWAAEATPQSVRITARGSAGREAVVGGFITARATLAPPPPPAAPDAFDIQRLMFFRGIGGLGRSLGAVKAEPPPEGYRPDVTVTLARLRTDLTERIQSVLPGDTGALAAALITGDRTAISDQTMQDMRNSGLAHLIAISGLNVGLVAGFVLLLIRGGLALVPAVALRYDIKKGAAVAALIAVTAYSLLSGLDVPVLRALVMFALGIGALLLDRKAISFRIIAFTALLVLACEPEALLGASFQMSFGAVVALIAAYEATQPWFTARRRASGWLGRGVLYALALLFTSIVSTIANAPFSAYHFDRIALFGIAANLVAVPLCGILIMPAAVIAMLLLPFGLDWIGFVPMGWGIDIIIATAANVAQWPGSVINVPAMPVWSLALITLGALWLFLWLQIWRWWGLGLVAAGILLAILTPPPDLLISGDGKLAAIRSEEGRLLLSRGARGIVAESWVARAGGEAPATFAAVAQQPGGPLACDEEGCVYRAEGQVIALARTRRAFIDDCRRASLLVALVPLRQPCPSPHLVIDRFDLWRNGSYAIWLRKSGVEMVSDRQRRGLRPWSLPPEPRYAPAPSASSAGSARSAGPAP
jgi:competence protein ComEC